MNALKRTLSGRRIGLLLRKDVTELFRVGLVPAGAVAGVILIAYVVSAVITFLGLGNSSSFNSSALIHSHSVVFSLLLFFGGIIVTSKAFQESHNNTKNHEWFMLPASTLEKFIVRLVLTTLGWTAVAVVGYFLATALSAVVSIVLTKEHFGVFSPFNRSVLLTILNYWVVQSIFLLGAAFFKKHHLVRTVLSLIVTGIAFAFFSGLVVRIVFAPYFDGVRPTPEMMHLFENFGDQISWESDFEGTARTLRIVFEVLYWALFAPACWVISYFRLKETEVSHGV